jgi:hypothetical protein
MVRKMGKFPKFLVLNSGTESFGSSSVFTFYLLLFVLYRFLYLLFRDFYYGVSEVLMSVFQMELNDYPTSSSPRMGDCVPWASTAWGSRECYTIHSSASATTGAHQSTVAGCPRLMAWTCARLAS